LFQIQQAMYNFKEKKLHFNALRNPDAAVYDLELLRQVRPWLPQLRTYARDPKRYASDILYSLLDLTTRESIRAFRRKKLDELGIHLQTKSPLQMVILQLLMRLPVSMPGILLQMKPPLQIVILQPLTRLSVPLTKTLQNWRK